MPDRSHRDPLDPPQKNYQNDGDSTFRLFYDTVKGGDFRARESNVYRLAEVSANIIDQSVAQGVPFAREYGGTLSNRTFGGVLVSRTFYARGQTGQQLLYGAVAGLMRQVDTGAAKLLAYKDVVDIITIDGEARGVVVRDLNTGKLEALTADAVVLATGGLAGGGIVYQPTEYAAGPEGAEASRSPFRLSLELAGSLVAVEGARRSVGSMFGPDLGALAWPRPAAPGALERVGVITRGTEVVPRVHAAGDVVAAEPRTVLRALRSGLAAGRGAARSVVEA